MPFAPITHYFDRMATDNFIPYSISNSKATSHACRSLELRSLASPDPGERDRAGYLGQSCGNGARPGVNYFGCTAGWIVEHMLSSMRRLRCQYSYSGSGQQPLASSLKQCRVVPTSYNPNSTPLSPTTLSTESHTMPSTLAKGSRSGVVVQPYPSKAEVSQ